MVGISLGSRGASGQYAGNAGIPFQSVVYDFINSEQSVSGGAASFISTTGATPASDITFLTLYKSSLRQTPDAASPSRGRLLWYTNSQTASDGSHIINPDTHNPYVCSGQILSISSNNQTFDIRIDNEDNDGTSLCRGSGIVGFSLSDNFTINTDYDYITPSTVDFTGSSADTDFDGPSGSVTITETGDHLIMWGVRIDGQNNTGTCGFRIDVDGTEPYSVVSGSGTVDGFRWEIIEGTNRQGFAGAAIHSFASTGEKTFKFIFNVDSGLANTSTRAILPRFFAIPLSKFRNSYYDSGNGSTTTSTTYQSTNYSVGPIDTNNPVLIMFSGPASAIDSAGVCSVETKFVSNGSTNLSDADDFLTISNVASSDITLVDVAPMFNFILAPNGLSGETVSLQFRQQNGGAGDTAYIGCQDDGTTDATAHLIAIELATT